MPKRDDADIIKALKNSKTKDKAFSDLLDMYQEKLYWHIRKIVVSHDNANDVMQNTFIRVYRSIGNFKMKSALSTWMYKIAYNESIRFLNKNKVQFNSLNEISSVYLETLSQDEYFDGDQIQKKLHEIVSGLTDKQREIFQMKYFDELSFRQISEILDINENTLKSSYYSSVKIIEENMTQ